MSDNLHTKQAYNLWKQNGRNTGNDETTGA